MAELLGTRHERCRCKHGCPTSAIIKEWSCGCVQVFILNDELAGWDCTDFTAMREHCGRPGYPREDE